MPGSDLDHHDHDDHDHDLGLVHDRGRLLDRRRLLLLAGGAGAALLVGCGKSGGSSSAPSTTTAATATTAATGSDTTVAATCAPIPEETAGPFPGDGSNGPDALSLDGIVRRDIRPSVGANDPVPGVPVTMTLMLVDTAAGCAPLAGAAVYAWHCDAEGRYSMYDSGVEDQTFLRGVQESGADGSVTFETVFPGCYPGRWPHVHFEIYENVDAAVGDGSPVATSQLAFPDGTCVEAYAADGYGSSGSNLESLSLDTDMVFSDDGGARQMATMTGSSADGYTATLTVAV